MKKRKEETCFLEEEGEKQEEKEEKEEGQEQKESGLLLGHRPTWEQLT